MSKSIAPFVAVLLSVSVLSTSNAAILVPTSLPDIGAEVTSDNTALVAPITMGDFPGANDRDLVVVFNDGKQLSASGVWLFDSFVINSSLIQFQFELVSLMAHAVDANGISLTSARYMNRLTGGVGFEPILEGSFSGPVSPIHGIIFENAIGAMEDPNASVMSISTASPRTFDLTVIPEPSSLAICCIGFLTLALTRRRKC
jgi:hypothetical protein